MSSNNQIIYILTNEAMPGYVKIGKTVNLEQRIKDLSSSTSVPIPFSCFYACIVKDMSFVEHQLHDAFDNNRINPKREFFKIDPERVVAALKLAEVENITPRKDIVENEEDRQALIEARNRRSPFRFDMVNILPNSEITFSRNENIKAKVLDNHFIELNGIKTTISKAAQELLDVEWPAQGPLYWKYEGETLDERRQRIENEIDEEDRKIDEYMSIQADIIKGK